jgi:hypothetical protein
LDSAIAAAEARNPVGIAFLANQSCASQSARS